MRLFWILVSFLALATAAQAQDDRGIEDVITQQLQAFNDRDIDGAWQFASPMIQGMFGTPQNFGAMVRNGYPMVWDNSDAQFMDQTGSGQLIMQDVFVRDAEGRGWILSYAMLQTEAGWRINGVSIVPAPDVAA